MTPRWRRKEVPSPATDFRPPINRDIGLHEQGQWRQPVDPTPDIDPRFRVFHDFNVSETLPPYAGMECTSGTMGQRALGDDIQISSEKD